MPVITASDLAREFETAGVPDSGRHKIKKSDLRRWGTWVEGFVGAIGANGGLVYDTKANLDSDLDHGANSSAWVIDDETVTNNGIYRKSGASGAGSWSRVADLPYSFIALSDVGDGTPNAIQATSDIPLPSTPYKAVLTLNVFEPNVSDGVTLAVNGAAAKPLVSADGSVIAEGTLTADMGVLLIDDGTNYRILTDLASAANLANSEAARDLARLWANAPEDETVVDPVNGNGNSSFHWAKKSEADANRAENEADRSEAARDLAQGWASNAVDASGLLPRYATVATLLADTDMGYPSSTPTFEVGEGVVVWAGPYHYRVAADDATDHHLETAGGVKLYVLPSEAGYAARAFNPAGDGVTDDSGVLNAAAQAIKAAGGGTLILQDTHYLGTTTFFVPAVVSVLMPPGAKLLYSGTGIGMHVDAESTTVAHRYGRWDVRIERAAIEWDTGDDTTSVGARFTNIREATIHVYQCDNFYHGLQPYGDTTGSVNCTFYLGLIRNNKHGIRPGRVNGGFANQNLFIGGAVRVDSSWDNITDYPSTLIDLTDGNAETFIGVNLEGETSLPSRCVYVGTGYNAFLNCRYEAQGAGTFVLGSGSLGNVILGGYHNFGPDSDIFDDQGSGNFIQGTRGMKLWGDQGGFGGPALDLHALQGNSAIMLQTRTTAGAILATLNANGVFDFFDNGGKGVVSQPSMRFNGPNNSIDFGSPDGSATPVSTIRTADGTNIDLENRTFRWRPTAKQVLSSSALADGATTVSLTSGGSRFVTANTGPTNLTNLSGATAGQVFVIQAGDANTTLVHGTSFFWRGGGNMALSNGEPVWFQATGTSTAWRIG